MPNSNQPQNNDEQLNPLVGGILGLAFWLVFMFLGFKVNPIMYIFGLGSIVIAGSEFRELYNQRNHHKH